MQDREILFADVQRAAAQRSPDFSNILVNYLKQEDPAPGQPEVHEGDQLPVGKDDWTLAKLHETLANARVNYYYDERTPEDIKATRLAAWDSLLATPHYPPRLDLGQLLLDLYQQQDLQARQLLLTLFDDPKLPIKWGVWQAVKSIYKQAEANYDIVMFSTIACHLDQLWIHSSYVNDQEIGRGTLIYLRRRSWRYLRLLGQALPELYLSFAIRVLCTYHQNMPLDRAYLAQHILRYNEIKDDYESPLSMWSDNDIPTDLSLRAFNEVWKLQPTPLFDLLTNAQHEKVREYGIRCLQTDFKSILPQLDVKWLIRWGSTESIVLQAFVLTRLTDSPDYHQSKLKALGLHDMLLAWLESRNSKVQAYALDYAQSYALDLSIPQCYRLLKRASGPVKKFAAILLEKQSATALGIELLAQLIGFSESQDWAVAKFNDAFTIADINQSLFIDLYLSTGVQQQFIIKFYAKTKVPAAYYHATLASEKCNRSQRNKILSALEKYPVKEIGLDWIKQAVLQPDLRQGVSKWLVNGMLTGKDLDIDWLKGLVFDYQTRGLALNLLNNRKWVKPQTIGLNWLLTLAKHEDEELHQFAHQYLLQSFTPKDFVDKSLWQMVTNDDESEPVREFAATYLTAHHPQHGKSLSIVRDLGIKPQLKSADYALDKVQPLFLKPREDTRQLAITIAHYELVNWNDPQLLYHLAASRFADIRRFASQVLLQIGEPETDPTLIPSVDWLQSEQVFGLTESRYKTSRELGLTLIRRHYQQLGGAKKLAWLMESPLREVRLFAVRLLWDQHRPMAIPHDWQPSKGEWVVPQQRFESAQALQDFLRMVLYGLPPGRMERRPQAEGEMPERALPASESKQRLLTIIRELALEQREFAALVIPVLETFQHSKAKAEWQACVVALAQIRRAYPDINVDLPAGKLPQKSRKS